MVNILLDVISEFLTLLIYESLSDWDRVISNFIAPRLISLLLFVSLGFSWLIPVIKQVVSDSCNL